MRKAQWIPSRADAPGLALVAIFGVAAVLLVRVLPPSPLLSDILIALTLGALVVNTPLRRLVGLVPPSFEREPDRWAEGLRFAGKWVLRLSIILMGLKVQTRIWGARELSLIGGIALVALPSTFFVTHTIGRLLGVRRPLADLLAGGTMICGASAVNAIAPVARAHRSEQGIAIAAVFSFSVFALVAFHPLAELVGLAPSMAGLWSGLAVNDLSSAIAVGTQMGGAGGVMATAAKSARVLLLAPTLIVLSFLRRDGAPRGLTPRLLDLLPRYLLGYIALAVVRATGDRVFGDAATWTLLLRADSLAVDFLLAAVAAGIGLHLELRSLVAAGARALATAGTASIWMASLTLAMISMVARGAAAAAALVGIAALITSGAGFAIANARERQSRALRRRFERGAPLSLGEAIGLLDRIEAESALDEALLRRLLAQLHPSIGELIPARESPLAHDEGSRWLTYWQGKSGWALVAVCRDADSKTPIHAHPHRLLGKTIEGSVEELRFVEHADDALELVGRRHFAHDEIVETEGLGTPHLIRVVGGKPAIDLQLRGPEQGKPGRRFDAPDLDLATLSVGSRVPIRHEIDDRPGHAGDGAASGRVA